MQAELLFPDVLQKRLPQRAIGLAMNDASFRTCARPRPALPLATREWLAEAAG